jgi:hypothetical protein
MASAFQRILTTMPAMRFATTTCGSCLAATDAARESGMNAALATVGLDELHARDFLVIR